MAPKGAELLAAVTRVGRQVREFFVVANRRNLPEPAVFDRLKWPVPAGFRPAINQGPAPQIRTAQEAARIEIRQNGELEHRTPPGRGVGPQCFDHPALLKNL
jgi:hypothetical protein